MTTRRPPLPTVKMYDRLSATVERGITLGLQQFLVHEARTPWSADAQSRLETHLYTELMQAFCEEFEV